MLGRVDPKTDTGISNAGPGSAFVHGRCSSLLLTVRKFDESSGRSDYRGEESAGAC